LQSQNSKTKVELAKLNQANEELAASNKDVAEKNQKLDSDI
jgi:hypothetical protein